MIQNRLLWGLCAAILVCSQPLMAITVHKHGLTSHLMDGYKLIIYDKADYIGSITTLQLPGIRDHILLDLYIKPAFRGRGYAKTLLALAVQDLEAHAIKRIFIQPGPFERDGHDDVHQLTGDERQTKLASLERLYSSFGFRRANSTALSMLLRVVYTILGVHEDPTYVMVRTNF